MSKNRTVIIVAGGSGSRMGAKLPKQFLLLANKPILMHTIEQFHQFDPHIKLIVCLPEEHHQMWNNLCKTLFFEIDHQVIAGGNTRFASVYNALQYINTDGVLAVHDGVRPFVSKALLETCFTAAEMHKAVVPCCVPIESLRKITFDSEQIQTSKAVDRAQYRSIQTPQVFDALTLKAAYQEAYRPEFTDDASVMDHVGQQIMLVEGSLYNIKITNPLDLVLAEWIYKEHFLSK